MRILGLRVWLLLGGSIALGALGTACDGTGVETSSGGGGAHTTTSGHQTGGGGTLGPTCFGEPLAAGDLETSADGSSFELPCSPHPIQVASVSDTVVRLTFSSLPARPSYAVLPRAQVPLPAIGATPETATLCTAAIRVDVDRATCRVRAASATGDVLFETPENEAPIALAPDPADPSVVVQTLRGALAEDEHLYGFGERTGPLDKRGRTMTFWNTDAYVPAFGGYPPDADPLYASIPMFVSLRGDKAHGLFLDDTHRLTFDMGAADSSRFSLASSGGAIDLYLIAGPEIPEVVARFTDLTGKPPLPPKFAIGFHQSRWGYSPDTKFLDLANEFRTRKIPADGLWLDIQHMDGFRSFTWDSAAFPDPEGLISSLAAQGFKAMAIIDPGVKVDPTWDVYADGLEKSLFLSKDGAPYVGEVWPGDAVFPDFSAPETREFWAGLVPRLTDVGIRGLWIDMNEPSDFVGPGGTAPNDLAAAGDGSPTTMAEMHNVYALNEARATFEGMRASAPNERPFLLSRAGYAGIQRYAAMWTGDAPSTWPTLQTTLPMLLGMGLSGLSFVGSDVGGYSGYATPELYARWMAVGALSPFFRAHVTTGVNDQEPWQLGFEVEDISRAVIEERYRLLPYLYSAFAEAHATGAPVLRPLVYAYQSDDGSKTRDDEALVGPSLLFAPVLEQGTTTRSVYFPPGRWFEYFSGAVFEGPKTVPFNDLPLAAFPLFVREGAIVPKQPVVQSTAEGTPDTVFLDIYPGDTASSFVLYEDDGASMDHEGGSFRRTTFTTAKTATGATLSVGPTEGPYSPPPRTIFVRVRRVDHPPSAVTLAGAPLTEAASEEALSAAEAGFFYDARDLALVVKLKEQSALDLTMTYDTTLLGDAPPVEVQVEVTVPAGTPQDPPIHFASSANGWTHAHLRWIAPNKASGLVPVPRGQWFYYKYTRGDWTTVEKWPGCVEATNRYAFGRAHPTKQDTVYTWADNCP